MRIKAASPIPPPGCLLAPPTTQPQGDPRGRASSASGWPGLLPGASQVRRTAWEEPRSCLHLVHQAPLRRTQPNYVVALAVATGNCKGGEVQRDGVTLCTLGGCNKVKGPVRAFG